MSFQSPINPGQGALAGAVEQQYLHERQKDFERGVGDRPTNDDVHKRRPLRARLWAKVSGGRTSEEDGAEHPEGLASSRRNVD